jgi:hypothetical protein
MKCAAEDMRGQDCKPTEGKYDGKPQFYCSRCGRKIQTIYFSTAYEPGTEEKWPDMVQTSA